MDPRVKPAGDSVPVARVCLNSGGKCSSPASPRTQPQSMIPKRAKRFSEKIMLKHPTLRAVVRMSRQNAHGAVNLLEQHHANQLMRPGRRAEGELQARF